MTTYYGKKYNFASRFSLFESIKTSIALYKEEFNYVKDLFKNTLLRK